MIAAYISWHIKLLSSNVSRCWDFFALNFFDMMCNDTDTDCLYNYDVVYWFCSLAVSYVVATVFLFQFEAQTSFGSIYKTRIEGNSMFCDYYNPQQKTYCKRLKVLCPEHTKERKVIHFQILITQTVVIFLRINFIVFLCVCGGEVSWFVHAF